MYSTHFAQFVPVGPAQLSPSLAQSDFPLGAMTAMALGAEMDLVSSKGEIGSEGWDATPSAAAMPFLALEAGEIENRLRKHTIELTEPAIAKTAGLWTEAAWSSTIYRSKCRESETITPEAFRTGKPETYSWIF